MIRRVGSGLLLAGLFAIGQGCAASEPDDATGGNEAFTGGTTAAFTDTQGQATNVRFNTSGAPLVPMHGPSAVVKAAVDELTRQGKDWNESFTAATFNFPSANLDPL